MPMPSDWSQKLKQFVDEWKRSQNSLDDGEEFLTHQKANGFWNDGVWRFAVVKLLIKKIRGLLEGARKWNAHEDGAAGRVGYTSVPYWRPWRDF
jgi:hypothetical protein